MSSGRFKLLTDVGLDVITMKMKITNFIAAKMVIHKVMGLYNASYVAFVIMEVHHSSPHPKGIQIIGKHHAAVPIRR